MTSGKRNYLLLSLFDFLYLFAWSSTMAFFVIWTTQHLGISATKTGLLYSVNAFIALLMQPFFGFISDKFGLKKRLIWLLVALLLPVGPFFIYVYAPLLVHNFWFGALLAGAVRWARRAAFSALSRTRRNWRKSWRWRARSAVFCSRSLAHSSLLAKR